ncbi:DNA cytosine methyltransferase [Streptomyces sp. NPDC051840]|uniref:DNA cytosine methyltransferase n=1 Tax=Streptomyces sp. NPDC051840 TaxID=3154752 RepID=UPI003445DC05
MTAALSRTRALLDQPPAPHIPGQLTTDQEDGMRIGSVCSGYRGLDAAVEAVFGGTTAWVSDIDPGANRILAHHWPDTPNLGDLTTVDWAAVEPVDIFCGGYPCQPFSNAGLRKGTDDERHIWPWIASALGVLRPRVAIFENVAGHLRLGFDTVLADLAALGFDAEWCVVRASEVGAPHPRRRLFILATAADATPPDEGRLFGGGESPEQTGRAEPGHSSALATDAPNLGHERARGARGRGHGPADHRDPAANPDSLGRRPGQPDLRPGQPNPAWGRFLPAIARWEHATGRRAPWATDDRNRLNPAFVEWLMGLPAGHVTGVPDLTRNQMLHALGNGVVPQQAEAAIRLLAARAGLTTATPTAA